MTNDFLKSAEDGNLVKLKTFLCESRTNTNTTNLLKQTALMLAVKQDNPNCVRELIKADADLNQQDKFGWTAPTILMLTICDFLF